MARSSAERGADKAAAIRDAFDDGKILDPLIIALFAVRSEAIKRMRKDSAGAGYVLAALTGHLLAESVLLSTRAPYRPAGCPRVPRPADLQRVFAESFEAAMKVREGARGEA